MPTPQAICADAPLDAGKGAPEVVQLLPAGNIEARDGRKFVLPDPHAVVAAFRRGGIDLPIDYEHQGDDPGRKQTGPVPAAGWIKDVEARKDGLWGRVEWTARARKLIAEREYRFLSPVFEHTSGKGQVLRLRGAGLVHHPALELKALARQEEAVSDQQSDLDRIAGALGIEAGANADTIVQAIAARETPDPAQYVPIEAVRELMSERNAQRAAMSETEAVAKVDRSVQQGYITPAMRDWALALCRRDPESLDSFLGATGPAFAYLSESPKADWSTEPGSAVSAEEKAVCDQLGLKPGALRS